MLLKFLVSAILVKRIFMLSFYGGLEHYTNAASSSFQPDQAAFHLMLATHWTTTSTCVTSQHLEVVPNGALMTDRFVRNLFLS